MGTRRLIFALVLVVALAACAFAWWRWVWFFRDPPRTPPAQPGIVSPADGTVVYVRRVAPGEDVVVIKQGLRASVRDLLREDLAGTKLVIGIFMSPFDVHFNRAPLAGTIGFIRRHPARGENAHMGPMHWRSLVGIEPRYRNSVHIVQNERTVTHFLGEYEGAPLSLYVVQIGARTVNGIDSYFREGERVERGQTFGMIRIGSQVDLVVPWRPGLEARVRPGQRVRAGETILVR
ncbi:MAG TPA: phosphatidylserine decarboxylase [Burkholderiales bacterium]|nr:phosphatidylserine decarboxylase [Burkholderiales bacterium]